MRGARGIRGRRIAIGVGAVALLVAARLALEPRRGPSASFALPAEARERAAAALKQAALDRRALLDALAQRRVLLLGESHFHEEPQAWAETLMSALYARDGRKVVLLLELPHGMQGAVEAYLATGDEREIVRAWRWHPDALPYQRLVRSRNHPDAVRTVVAYDEPAWHVALMRVLMTDTRNATMASAIVDAAREALSDRIVAYGGRLHMMNAGRYLYDSTSRSPIGARLRALGVSAQEIAAVWLLSGPPPVDGVWSEPGAVSLAGLAGQLPIAAFETEAVYGASRIAEVADFAVFLGPATPIAGM